MAVIVITVSCLTELITTSALTIMKMTTIGTFMPWWEVAVGDVWMVGRPVWQLLTSLTTTATLSYQWTDCHQEWVVSKPHTDCVTECHTEVVHNIMVAVL